MWGEPGWKYYLLWRKSQWKRNWVSVTYFSVLGFSCVWTYPIFGLFSEVIHSLHLSPYCLFKQLRLHPSCEIGIVLTNRFRKKKSTRNLVGILQAHQKHNQVVYFILIQPHQATVESVCVSSLLLPRKSRYFCEAGDWRQWSSCMLAITYESVGILKSRNNEDLLSFLYCHFLCCSQTVVFCLCCGCFPPPWWLSG